MSVPGIPIVWKKSAGMAALLFVVFSASCGGMILGRAQTPLQATVQSPGQPSGRVAVRMARLTYVVGQVQLVGRDGGNAQPAVRNVPVLEGSVLSTANDGQAEIEFEDGRVVRLTPNSA